MAQVIYLPPKQGQQQQGGNSGGGMGGFNPSGIIDKFLGGSGAALGGGEAASTGAISDFGSAGTGVISGGEVVGGSAGGGAGSSTAGGGGWMSSIGSWGPWAALAAVIIGNETDAVKDGDRNRREGSDYWQDLLTGEVLQQDMESWGIGNEGDNGFLRDMMFGVQASQLDFGDAADSFKETTLGRALRSIF